MQNGTKNSSFLTQKQHKTPVNSITHRHGPRKSVRNKEVSYGVTGHISETSSAVVLDGTFNFRLTDG